MYSLLPGFKAIFHGDGQSALNPGTTVFGNDMVFGTVIHLKSEIE